METTDYSITKNGLSVCRAGEENYTTFRPAYRPNQQYYQYDYRDKSGDLFSCVAPTLEECRAKRNKWVQSKNYQRLFPSTLKKIQEVKRLTKCEMAYQIGQVEPLHVVSISWNYFTRDEIVKTFNQMFGTEIK